MCNCLRVCLLVSCFCLAAPVYAEVPPIPSSQPTVWSTRPDIAAFEKIESDRLAAAGRIVQKLARTKGAPSVDHTLADYDRAVERINAAVYFASIMEAVHPDAKFRDAATAMKRKAYAAATELSLNHAVYRALSGMEVSHADAATRFYVKRQLLLFRLAGVDKDAATRARLKTLNDDLAEEQSAFDRNISDGQLTVTVKDPGELAGLPQDYIDRHTPGTDGLIKITTAYPDALPVLKFAKSESLRRRVYEAFDNRAYPANREVLRKLLQTRYDIATLLGYKSWADYNAADKMVGEGAKIGEFIERFDQVVKPAAAKELQLLLAEKRKTSPEATRISLFERSYYQEQLRRSQYDFDSTSVRPYFPFPRVKQGILDTAAGLFHVSFRRDPAAPVWDPTVEVWEVIDQGRPIGRFYLDMHPRAGKYSHAEMGSLLDGVAGKQLPEGVLICNFPAPTATDPGLMEYNDVEVFFHEFGHLMHFILGGQQRWAGISGISMEGDFVESPSQMLEEGLRSPQVLALFARDYKTNAPIPTELVLRMNRAAAFGRASYLMMQNYYSALSYDFYKDKPDAVDFDVVTARDQARLIDFEPLPGVHEYASFTHLSGYSSSYYTYMWDKVIALDFFEQFDAGNMLSGPAPMRYRREVLEPGGSMSANDLVEKFLGRPQNMDALKRWLNEEFR